MGGSRGQANEVVQMARNALQGWVAVAGLVTAAVALAWPVVARAVIDSSIPVARNSTWFGDGLIENLFAAVGALWILAWFLVVASIDAILAAVVVVLGVRLIHRGFRTRAVWAGLLGAALAVALTGYDWLALLMNWPPR